MVENRDMIIKFIPDTITEHNFTEMYSSLPTESKEILSDAVLYSLSRQNIETGSYLSDALVCRLYETLIPQYREICAGLANKDIREKYS